MNKTYVLLAGILSLSLGFSTAAPAQEPGEKAPPRQERDRSQGEAQKVTVTGCLTKGTTADEFVITDQKSGKKLPFAASAKLEKYVNQTVALTGTLQNRGGQSTFVPEKLDPVSESCEAPAKP